MHLDLWIAVIFYRYRHEFHYRHNTVSVARRIPAKCRAMRFLCYRSTINPWKHVIPTRRMFSQNDSSTIRCGIGKPLTRYNFETVCCPFHAPHHNWHVHPSSWRQDMRLVRAAFPYPSKRYFKRYNCRLQVPYIEKFPSRRLSCMVVTGLGSSDHNIGKCHWGIHLFDIDNTLPPPSLADFQ